MAVCGRVDGATKSTRTAEQLPLGKIQVSCKGWPLVQAAGPAATMRVLHERERERERERESERESERQRKKKREREGGREGGILRNSLSIIKLSTILCSIPTAFVFRSLEVGETPQKRSSCPRSSLRSSGQDHATLWQGLTQSEPMLPASFQCCAAASPSLHGTSKVLSRAASASSLSRARAEARLWAR